MEMRNGVWTSQTKASDVREIVRLARKIRRLSDQDAETTRLARKIERLADGVARDLE